MIIRSSQGAYPVRFLALVINGEARGWNGQKDGLREQEARIRITKRGDVSGSTCAVNFDARSLVWRLLSNLKGGGCISVLPFLKTPKYCFF